LTGLTTPLDVIGLDGDIYYKLDADGVVIATYEKVAGTWVVIGAINPVWTPYTPTVTSSSGTITSFNTVVFRYYKLGKTLFFRGAINVGNNGTGAGWLVITLPYNAASIGSSVYGARSWDIKSLAGYIASGSSPRIILSLYDGTYPVVINGVLAFAGSYEIE
jgi:hypothetical protein